MSSNAAFPYALIGALCVTSLIWLVLSALGLTPESHVYLMYEGVYCV